MKELIKQCRCYKGEEKCPEHLYEKGKGGYWMYEKMWVEEEGLRDEGRLGEYIRAGLKDFNTDDGTHITLKALLFNRYEHWSGNYGDMAGGFKEWYVESYLGKVD